MTIPQFERWGVWLDVPSELREPLRESTTADAVVIGGGYAGLCTALALREAGKDVVLLERDFAGAGASGCNAGLIDGALANDIPMQERLLGKDRALRLTRFSDDAVEALERRIAKHDIACDYARVGSIVAALHPGQSKYLEKRTGQLLAHGSEARFLDGEAMRSRGLPAAFREGILQEAGGRLDPGKYVLGLRTAAIEAGVRLYEGTRVESIVDGAEVEVRANRASVRAPWAILTTNAFTPDVGRARRVVVPFRVCGIETEPLDDERRARLGWPSAEGVITTHPVLESFRLTERGALQVSTRKVTYGFGWRRAPAEAPSIWRLLEWVLRERFPEVGDVRVARAWSGWVAFTPQFAPVFGVEGPHGNVLYGIGFCGHGIAAATLMGEVLATHVLGDEHPHEAAVRRKPLRYPPEPLTWVGAKLALGGMNFANGFTDRAARRSPRP